ncbi:hypothetical protein [Burkholderia gladioli]|uniref:Uncharacterized protein n=1 Tax=Burkholderia gladioli TaxID=28095 RepID=A0AB38TMB8_BURGA|nr:hypothetical protein [Burkholderia gladioli]MBJ9673097.1 hypothetical protein [Burkholderia gladioli]MBU9187528.1 hypothetical protein [Burkholderia gladioli]MBU9266637.1 hypothetical protein [Burkholderia gladioli]MBU9274613.1 hypothetical protein [Burkholderia gladioli]MBU9319391.1 hypothetical protein [Burkholderia gladioli]
MTTEALDPLLRQFAEKRLGRPLQPGEEHALLELLPSRQGKPAAPAATPATQAPTANPPLQQLKTRKEAREQIKHFLQLNQQKAYEKMQGILQTIDTQNETTLGMLASEQQRVSGVLDEHEPPGDAQASATGEIQDSTRQALAMIGEQLTGLIRQEIESCFRQYVDPLARRLDAIGELLRDIAAIPSEPATPAAAATIPVHDTPGPASME